MGIFYDSVLKMREHGKSLINKPKTIKVAPKKPTVEVKQSSEMAVKKHDKSAGAKS